MYPASQKWGPCRRLSHFLPRFSPCVEDDRRAPAFYSCWLPACSSQIPRLWACDRWPHSRSVPLRIPTSTGSIVAQETNGPLEWSGEHTSVFRDHKEYVSDPFIFFHSSSMPVMGYMAAVPAYFFSPRLIVDTARPSSWAISHSFAPSPLVRHSFSRSSMLRYL